MKSFDGKTDIIDSIQFVPRDNGTACNIMVNGECLAAMDPLAGEGEESVGFCMTFFWPYHAKKWRKAIITTEGETIETRPYDIEILVKDSYNA